MLNTDSSTTPFRAATPADLDEHRIRHQPAIGTVAEPIPFPTKRYQVIYADPPWRYYGDPNKDQAAGKHYDLISTADIAAFAVRSITAPSAALFLWATGPRLPEAIEVMAAWGLPLPRRALGVGEDRG